MNRPKQVLAELEVRSDGISRDAARVIREMAADLEWAIDAALSQGGIGGDAEDIARANAAREKWRLE